MRKIRIAVALLASCLLAMAWLPQAVPVAYAASPKTVTVKLTLSGVHAIGDFPLTQWYNDGTYSGTLIRQDNTKKNVVRATPTCDYYFKSDKAYANDHSVSQYAFPATYTFVYFDFVSGQSFPTSLPKLGAAYFYGEKNTKTVTWDHCGYQYDAYAHSKLGYMSNNTSTYFGGRYSSAPVQPHDYYGPPGEAGLGWAQYKAPTWDGGLQDAQSQPWKSICLAKNGVAKFESDTGGSLNRYRKPVHLYYRRTTTSQYIYQHYQGKATVTDTVVSYAGTVETGGPPPTPTPIPTSPPEPTTPPYTEPPPIWTPEPTPTPTPEPTPTPTPVPVNHPPTVTLTSDKGSYFEGDTAVFSALVTDPDGDNLTVTMTTQDMGQAGTSPGPVVNQYTGTVASGTILRLTYPGMIPHPLKVTVTAVDTGGLSDTKTKTVTTVPKPIDGFVNHTDVWELHRQEYNAWATRTGLASPRPPELFFRGEIFVLKATTSRYLACNYVKVTIKEHPTYTTTMSSMDGFTWTDELWGDEMFDWPAQTLTFVFENQYVDGTITTDTVVVRIDTEEYFRIHMLY